MGINQVWFIPFSWQLVIYNIIINELLDCTNISGIVMYTLIIITLNGEISMIRDLKSVKSYVNRWDIVKNDNSGDLIIIIIIIII